MKCKFFLPLLFLFVVPYNVNGMKISLPVDKIQNLENQNPNKNNWNLVSPVRIRRQPKNYGTVKKRTVSRNGDVIKGRNLLDLFCSQMDAQPIEEQIYSIRSGDKKLRNFIELQDSSVTSELTDLTKFNSKKSQDAIKSQDSNAIYDFLCDNQLFKGNDEKESTALIKDMYSEYTKYCLNSKLKEKSCKDFFEILSNEFKNMKDFASFKGFFDNLEQSFVDFCLCNVYDIKQDAVVKRYAGYSIFGKSGVRQEMIKDLVADLAKYIHYGTKENELKILRIIKYNNLSGISKDRVKFFHSVKKVNENLRYYK